MANVRLLLRSGDIKLRVSMFSVIRVSAVERTVLRYTPSTLRSEYSNIKVMEMQMVLLISEGHREGHFNLHRRAYRIALRYDARIV